MPDCKAFETIINFLGASDIAIEGVIVDKGFWNAKSPNVMDCRYGRSNHYNIQYQINTFNHKGSTLEIV